jgi:hypothetical protein
MTRAILPLVFLFATSLVAGCGSDPEPTDNTIISAVGYDKSCMTSDDCAQVFVGDVCGCGCTVEAIRASEVERYNQEVAEKRAHCDQVLTCAPCPDSHVSLCVSGACTVK